MLADAHAPRSVKHADLIAATATFSPLKLRTAIIAGAHAA